MQAVISTVENQAGDGLLSIADLPAHCGGGQVGATPLLHFLYKSPMRAQVIMPAFAPPLDTPGLQQVGTLPFSVHSKNNIGRKTTPGMCRLPLCETLQRLIEFSCLSNITRATPAVGKRGRYFIPRFLSVFLMASGSVIPSSFTDFCSRVHLEQLCTVLSASAFQVLVRA